MPWAPWVAKESRWESATHHSSLLHIRNALWARLGTHVARSDHACEVILTSNTHHQGQHACYTGLFGGAFDGKS